MFIRSCRKHHDPLVPTALFSLSWIVSAGLACLKLSALQTDWEWLTWLTIYLIFAGFLLGFRLLNGQIFSCFDPGQTATSGFRVPLIMQYECTAKQLKTVVVILTSVSVLCFLAEAALLGFIPLFTSDTPHAYSTFHISGLHYFTVLCVLVPPFFIVFNEWNGRKADVGAIICLVISLILPLLMVSRFQLIFSLLLAGFTFVFLNYGRLSTFLRPRIILLCLLSLCLIVLTYVFITIERAHSIEYLNGIFEIKYTDMPIFISQPYIYITNNFDNLNALIRDLPKHSYGLKMLFPFFALSGLKFIFPSLVDFPIYVTKEELTTVTMFYDAWYDFGTIGCFLFAFLLGLVYALLYRRMKQAKTPVFTVLYAQMITYLCLSFFTTWFSNPATWFYLGITIVIDFILWLTDKRKKSEKG